MTYVIASKWPHVRVVGQRVTPEQAMSFISKTEDSLFGNMFTNNKVFQSRFEKAFPFLKEPKDLKEWRSYYDSIEEAKIKYGYVELQHLGSRFVASCWIGGPYGLVKPDGEVSLCQNFGKWPSIEEVESDLDLVSKKFPWLDFHMYMWDNAEEECDGVTNLCWEVSNGSFKRVEFKEDILEKMENVKDPTDTFLERMFEERRETTWTVKEINDMWGDDLRKAYS